MPETFFDYAVEENANLLAQITEGRVPLQELHLTPHQKVSLQIDYRQGQAYEPVRPAVSRFSGAGSKLGSTQASTGGATGETGEIEKTSEIVPDFPLDPSLPATAVQVRFRDGGRKVRVLVNVGTRLGEIVDWVSRCTGIPVGDFQLISMTVPGLGGKESLEKTVGELKIQNSLLIQK